jgi:hypothetical protein
MWEFMIKEEKGRGWKDKGACLGLTTHRSWEIDQCSQTLKPFVL